MDGLIALLIILTVVYWGATIYLIISGTLILTRKKFNHKKSEGISKLIIGIIMLIIGGSICGPLINL